MTPLTEPQIVARVTARLLVRLPDLSPERVEEVVAAVVGHYRDSRVRDFLPVLVEREALRTLLHTSDHDAA
ncbi:three-helix bundle dimerization domain-containing protein [Nocardioides sp.]|uniref:three-helix bundle dimerization domain-containing protein n=1 Tax=Nocardioides sp. TaxID=35761 RepID=UPI001A1CFE87|nr:hypothetical protein [Nocardioides sp.]MBJ7355957.1 hypothetical protein [Nocardioides sp.]